MTTSKYNSLTPQDQCLVDASMSAIDEASQKTGIVFDKDQTAMMKEITSGPDAIKQVEGYARKGIAPWAKCLPKP